MGAGVEVAADVAMADEVENYVLKPAANTWVESIKALFGLHDGPCRKERQLRAAMEK